MSEFEQQPSENPKTWLSRLSRADPAALSVNEQRLRTYYLADAKRLLQEEQQKVKWQRGA